MFFIFSLTAIAISCSVLTTKTLVGYIECSQMTKFLSFAFVVLCWMSPIFIMIVKKAMPNTFVAIYTSHIMYFFFGMAFILFVVLLSRDIIWYLGYFFGKLPNPKDVYWLSRMNFAALFLSLIISLYSFYEGTKEAGFKEITIYSDKIEKDFKIALVTDLHINQGTTENRLKSVVSRVNATNPGVILLVGDIIDDEVKVLGSKIDVLNDFKSKYGNYLSLGNHELYNGLSSWIAKFSSIKNITLLNNKGVDIEEAGVHITGIPDTRISRNLKSFEPNLEDLMKDVSENRYKILLSHAPEVVDILPQDMYDLQVSGHTHGGQIFPFHILAKLENKYLAGLYDVENGTKIYVSRGAGYWGPPARFLAPSEITLITIKKQLQ